MFLKTLLTVGAAGVGIGVAKKLNLDERVKNLLHGFGPKADMDTDLYYYSQKAFAAEHELESARKAGPDAAAKARLARGEAAK
jgi:hypothetical protein